LLVALFKEANGLKKTLWDCLCLVRATLFQRPDSEASTYRKRRRETRLLAWNQGCLFQ
jgi:hypothetical protein